MKYDTIAKLIAMLRLQVKNLPTFQTEVGATAADITEVTNDLANLEYLDDQSGIVDADKRTLTQIKQAVYNGDPDDSVADFPVFPVLTPPQPMVAGALPRAQDRNRRFKAAPGYTPEIGVALGIEGESKEAVDLNTFTPHADLFASQSGYLFSCVVTNRGESDMWEVLVRPQGASNWTSLGNATGKSADFTYAPQGDSAGKPVLLNVRIQLKKKNQNYGQPSDIIQVTLNP